MAREGHILVSPESWEESKVLQFLPGFGFCHVEISICYMGETERERNSHHEGQRPFPPAKRDRVLLEFLENGT